MQWILWVSLDIFGLGFGYLPAYGISTSSNGRWIKPNLVCLNEICFFKCLKLGAPCTRSPTCLPYCYAAAAEFMPRGNTQNINPYPGNGEGKIPQCGFCRKSHSKQRSETGIFVTLLQTPWAFRHNWVYRYIYFRFYVAGLILMSTWLVLRLSALYARETKTNFTDGMLKTENGKMTSQECKQRYLYIFKMTDKTGSSNRSSSRAQSVTVTDSYSRINVK